MNANFFKFVFFQNGMLANLSPLSHRLVLVLVLCTTGALLYCFATFDFCLLLDASLSVYKRVDEEPSSPNPMFIKDILVVDGIPLLSWSVSVSTSSLFSSSKSTKPRGSFSRSSLSLFSFSSCCDGALPFSFNCKLKISNCVSPLGVVSVIVVVL
jgi:hypothetical protein